MVNLISNDFLKTLLDVDEESFIETIGQVNQRVSSLIEEYLDTTLEVKSYENEVYDAASTLILYHMPIKSVESIVLISGDSETPLAENTDFYVYPDRISLPNVTPGRKNLKISYEAGLETIPQMCYIVAEELVRYWAFKASSGDGFFYKSEGMEDRSYTNSDVTELKILSKLAPYRQRSLPKRSTRPSFRIGVI